MGRLTTHVLDTTHGKPGHGIGIRVLRIQGDERQSLGSATTNDDGRCDAPLLEGDELVAGVYELVFATGDYFKRLPGMAQDESIRFLDDVVIRFGVANPTEHYHVPLLISPYSYATYRGS